MLHRFCPASQQPFANRPLPRVLSERWLFRPPPPREKGGSRPCPLRTEGGPGAQKNFLRFSPENMKKLMYGLTDFQKKVCEYATFGIFSKLMKISSALRQNFFLHRRRGGPTPLCREEGGSDPLSAPHSFNTLPLPVGASPSPPCSAHQRAFGEQNLQGGTRLRLVFRRHPTQPLPCQLVPTVPFSTVGTRLCQESST